MLGMKTVLLLLFALAVATGPARALRCHVCNYDSCRQPQTCPASSSYCRTVTTVDPLSGNLVRKECSSSCTPTPGRQGQVGRGTEFTQCCQGDLCNAAPARTLLSSATLGLALGLGLLALIVPSL